MIRNPIDAAVYVSPELSSFLDKLTNDPDLEQPLTLAQVRDYLAGLMPDSFTEAEHLHHFDVSDSILNELDALVDEFGPSALAVEFSRARASEALSRVIEAVVDDENRENPPTLEEVREAMMDGLVNRLVGDGVLEEDEDDVLEQEVDELIERFGDDALAEDFLRYE
jgi:hypothetical protein